MYFETEFMTRGKENKWKNDTKYICLNGFLCFVSIDCLLLSRFFSLSFSSLARSHAKFLLLFYILPLCYCSLNLHIYTCTDGPLFPSLFSQQIDWKPPVLLLMV